MRRSRYVVTNLKPFRTLLAKVRAAELRTDLTAGGRAGRMAAWSEKVRAARDPQAVADELLPEVYAEVCRAAREVFGWEVFDSQLLAAIAMSRGSVIELDTGEGKTLVAVFVACLQALSGRGVHVLTFNDYLAGRDADWMGPVYERMGLRVGVVHPYTGPTDRRAAYACDVTYLTAKEAGFDYLRGFLALGEDEMPQRPLHSAIVDEADSILIDEARIPLILSGSGPGAGTLDPGLYRLIARMREGTHYRLDEYREHVLVTEEGAVWLERRLGVSNLYDAANVQLLTQVRLLLQAHALLRRDVDYLVRDGRIELVDEFTGRVIRDRQLPEGLHEAVEIKEGLSTGRQGQILNRITLHDFLSLYNRICGMTGTAWSAAPELDAFYGIDVVRIPPHVPCRRIDRPDRIYRTKAEKEAAVLMEIVDRHRQGQPVLVGTASVEESERLAERVRASGIACEVLNAKRDDAEAAVIARAGQAGAVTLSTNMAGRGVDIRLGPGVRDGLYIIGTNLHRSVRIDRQLRGRAGRQGDPGESRFLVSLEDDLVVRYRVRDALPPEWQERAADAGGSAPADAGDPIPIADPRVAEALRHTQRVIEGQLYQQRKSLLKYSVLIEEQRRQIHRLHEDLVTGRETLRIWQDRNPERCSVLTAAVGPEELSAAQRQAGALLLNQGWADYLEGVERLLDHVPIVRSGPSDPWATFQNEIIGSYARLLDSFEAEMLVALERLEPSGGRLDPAQAGLIRPSATRTYLIDDGGSGPDWDSGLATLIAAAVNPTLYGLVILAGWWKRIRIRKSAARGDEQGEART